MSLTPQPNPDAPDDYDVMHGALQVGRIYKRKLTLKPESQWLWALNGVPVGPPGQTFTGPAVTLDEALAALKERWDKWLAWADLSEGGGTRD